MKKHLVIFLFFILADQMLAQVNPALEIIADLPKVRDFTLGPDGTEAYISIQSPMEEISVIGKLKKENGVWLKPELVDFTGSFFDLEPMFSPDGLRLYFVSNRPLKENESSKKDFDIWYVERENSASAWSKPVNLESVNTPDDEFYPSQARNKNLYFTRESKKAGTKDDIWFCEWKKSAYGKAVVLSDSINSSGYEFNAFISPDESFLIYTAYTRKEGKGSGDLYISYKKDGVWGQAKNLGGEINSNQMDYCPFFDPQTNTLYFTSKRNELPELQIKSYEDLLKIVNGYSNGSSRIYEVRFEPGK